MSDNRNAWSWLFTRRTWFMVWFPILLVTAAHYSTHSAHHWLHDIFRRLYYIPIVLAAFHQGLRGALAASIFASLIYIPHAFTHVGHHDPAGTTQKVLEIVLYNLVALITGWLAQRERSERLRQEHAASDLARALEEKELLEEQLVRSGRLQALGELTAGLAHEIKNPLASILGSAEIIADEIPEDSEKRAIVDIQMTELHRLRDLLNRFLRFAKPGSVNQAVVDLDEVANHLVELTDVQARRTGIEVVRSPGCRELSVAGDAKALQQVLLNLVLNAIDASPDKGTVEVRCARVERGQRSWHTVSVSDQGPGVPPGKEDEIFNPFVTTKEDGTGLGLSIASRIVDQHNGFIEVTPGPSGDGATFTVFIPPAQMGTTPS
jgi:signal transduction histidine kinase